MSERRLDRLAGRQQDGREFHYGAGDAFALDPGHDVWVEGDEIYVSIDVAQPQRRRVKQAPFWNTVAELT